MADEQEANLGGSGDRQQRFARVMARQSRRDALGTLKNCFSFRNRPRSFSLINGQLRSDGGPTVLMRNRSRIPFTPQTGCDPATAETAARKQLLTLQKTVKLTDYDVTTDEISTKRFNPKQITVSRPSGLRTTNSKFVARGSGCRTHGFYVDEVTYDEWDQVRVDSQGVAAFYNNVALREVDEKFLRRGKDATPGSGCPIGATVIGSHYTIPDGEGAAPANMDRDISQSSYNNSLRRGPFLSVRPGETKTKTLIINKSDGRIKITYRLTNHTQRVRPRDN